MADFIYCLNSSTIRPTPLLDKIRVARAAGYAAIELWHDDVDLYLSQGGTLASMHFRQPHVAGPQNSRTWRVPATT